MQEKLTLAKCHECPKRWNCDLSEIRASKRWHLDRYDKEYNQNPEAQTRMKRAKQEDLVNLRFATVIVLLKKVIDMTS